MRKILFFAALGALGALLGAVIGEPGFRRALAWAKSYAPLGQGGTILAAPEPPPIASPVQRQLAPADVAPPEPPPAPRQFTKPAAPEEPPPPPPEFALRLLREHAQTGDVQISLLWNSAADLDLECVDPLGELVFVTHPSSSGGTQDVDMNGTVAGIPTRKDVQKPVENIFWPKGKAPPGRYQVFVINCNPHGTAQPTRYELNVLANGRRKSHVGSIQFAGHKKHPIAEWGTGIARDLVCEFEVAAPQAPAPQLAIAVPRRMDIAPGGANRFQVRIVRGFFEGDVRIELLDRPSDVEANPVSVPGSTSEGTVEVRAKEGAEPGERVLKVMACAETPSGRVRAEGTVLLAVQSAAPAAEPVLKLSVPKRIEVERGGAAAFKLRIGRWYFPRPVTVTARLEGDGGDSAAGLSSDSIQLAPGTDVGVLEVRAGTDARVGVQTVRVTVRAEAPFEANCVEQSVRLAVVDPAPQAGPVWPMALAAGGWTAFVGLGVSLSLAVGQNRYVGRGWIGRKQASLLVPGAVLAGVVAGAMGQASASWMAEAATVGHFAGWLLLGALLGRGVAFFVPNLKGLRATAAGTAGGLLGAVALMAGTHGEAVKESIFFTASERERSWGGAWAPGRSAWRSGPWSPGSRSPVARPGSTAASAARGRRSA